MIARLDDPSESLALIFMRFRVRKIYNWMRNVAEPVYEYSPSVFAVNPHGPINKSDNMHDVLWSAHLYPSTSAIHELMDTHRINGNGQHNLAAVNDAEIAQLLTINVAIDAVITRPNFTTTRS